MRLLMLLTALLAAPPAVAAEAVMGRASIQDGDTLEIRGQKFRLRGVDAPEAGQTCGDRSGRPYRCGSVAANALAARVGAATVTCRPVLKRNGKVDRTYDRIVAKCYLKGEDLQAWLARQGHAMAYLEYGGADYAAEEASARAAKRGIWAGSVTPPWEWRKRRG